MGYTKKDAEAKKAEAAELHAQIAAKVETLANGDEWMNYLRFMSGFHKYSLNNVMLMWAQAHVAGREAPSLVAGFGQWQDKGYQVRKGEKGMRIFAFSKKMLRDAEGKPVRDEDGKIRYRVFFPVVSVFDVSQTEPVTEAYTTFKGKKVPVAQPLDVFDPQKLQGDDVAGLRDKVAAFVTDQGWSFELEAIAGSTNGYTTLDGSKRVVVDVNLSPAQQAKTALHEAAHMLLHATKDGQVDTDAPTSRAVLELEAESVAFVTGAILGLDTEAYSDKYLLHWASRADGENPGEAIRATAERVQRGVKTLVSALTDEAEDQGEGGADVVVSDAA